MDYFGQLLELQLGDDRNRIHYDKQRTINELAEEEHQYLVVLSEEDYPVFKEEQVKASKYYEIVVGKTKAYVPKGYNYPKLNIIKY